MCSVQKRIRMRALNISHGKTPVQSERCSAFELARPWSMSQVLVVEPPGLCSALLRSIDSSLSITLPACLAEQRIKDHS